MDRLLLSLLCLLVASPRAWAGDKYDDCIKASLDKYNACIITAAACIPCATKCYNEKLVRDITCNLNDDKAVKPWTEADVMDPIASHLPLHSLRLEIAVKIQTTKMNELRLLDS